MISLSSSMRHRSVGVKSSTRGQFRAGGRKDPTGCCGRVAVADDRASAGVIIRRVRPKHAGTAQDFSEPPAAARQRATTYPPVLGARTCTTTNPVRRHGRREWVRDPVTFYVCEQSMRLPRSRAPRTEPTHPRVLIEQGVNHRCQPRTIT
jgi:hypothetical protein